MMLAPVPCFYIGKSPISLPPHVSRHVVHLITPTSKKWMSLSQVKTEFFKRSHIKLTSALNDANLSPDPRTVIGDLPRVLVNDSNRVGEESYRIAG